ncbi:MAG: hypothetical protein HY722_04960 [Planctomycetes bacterium]|nr:hypothetical protein [Planctomycetota bacterium]
MDCELARLEIPELLTPEPPGRAEARSHLAACPACQAWARRQDALLEELRRAGDAPPGWPADPEVYTRRVLAALPPPPPRAVAGRGHGPRVLRAAAAVLLVTLGLAAGRLYPTPSRPGEPAPEPPPAAPPLAALDDLRDYLGRARLVLVQARNLEPAAQGLLGVLGAEVGTMRLVEEADRVAARFPGEEGRPVRELVGLVRDLLSEVARAASGEVAREDLGRRFEDSDVLGRIDALRLRVVRAAPDRLRSL